jgi:acyl-CoA thioesterase II
MERAILGALDNLERALQLEPQGDNRFRAHSEPSRFGRVFGGQLLAQALQAASVTVSDHLPHSLHAYFVQSGDTDTPLDILVERVRDGRSMATRQVNVLQQGRSLLTAIASFHTNPPEPELPQPALNMPPPEESPLLQHWVQDTPPRMRPNAQTWVDVPPPLEMRIAEPPTFLGGVQAAGPRSHWMRLPRDIGDRPAVHTAMLAYASDYLLLDMASRAHPEPVDYASVAALSLDHAIWLHRPVRFDEWHLHTQEMVAITGHRGMVRGTIRDAAGHRVASTAQEVLVRPIRTK